MSRKSQYVGDYVPLDRGGLDFDISIVRNNLSKLRQQIASLGDKYPEQISDKTDKLLIEVHQMDYFLLSMKQKLYDQPIDDDDDETKAPPLSAKRTVAPSSANVPPATRRMSASASEDGKEEKAA